MPSAKGGSGKMLSLINYRLRVTLSDGRQIIGQLLAFDAHMNVVLSESEEFRRLKRSKKSKAGAKATTGGDEDDEEQVTMPEPEQKRTLGLIILRGESIVSLSVEAPPPQAKEKPNQLVAGPGRGAPAGRGMGLTAPPPGASMAGRPMNYGPPPGMPGMPNGPPPGFRPPGMPGGPPMGMPMPGYGRPPPGFGGFPPRPPQ